MCIDFDGHHSGGSSFVYVNYFLLLQKLFVYPQVQVRFEKKKKGKESQYIVSRPRPGSDPPFGLDRESGCDNRTQG